MFKQGMLVSPNGAEPPHVMHWASLERGRTVWGKGVGWQDKLKWYYEEEEEKQYSQCYQLQTALHQPVGLKPDWNSDSPGQILSTTNAQDHILRHRFNDSWWGLGIRERFPGDSNAQWGLWTTALKDKSKAYNVSLSWRKNNLPVIPTYKWWMCFLPEGSAVGGGKLNQQ